MRTDKLPDTCGVCGREVPEAQQCSSKAVAIVRDCLGFTPSSVIEADQIEIDTENDRRITAA